MSFQPAPATNEHRQRATALDTRTLRVNPLVYYEEYNVVGARRDRTPATLKLFVVSAAGAGGVELQSFRSA
eukprot:3025277-Rhodomonas_salina.1